MAKKSTKKNTRGRAAKAASQPRQKRAVKKAKKTAAAARTAKSARRAKPKPAKATRPPTAAAARSGAKASKRPQKSTTAGHKAPKPSRAASSSPLAKPKTPLGRKDLEQFRGMLLEKRAQLLGDVHTLRNEALKGSRQDSAGDLSSMPIHMAELGTDNYELEFTLGLIEGGRALLQEINEALERIRDGTYGICLATGRSIGKARLRAKPWAKYCYEYELAQETGQRP